MNTKKIKSSLLLAAILLAAPGFFGACKKKDPAPTSQMGAIVPAYPQPGDADAVLVAVNSSTPSPVSMPTVPGMPTGGADIVIDYGLGVALFKNNVKADKVLLNNTELTFTNGVHTWLPNFTNILDPSSVTGINLSGNITWNVTNPDIQRTLSGLPGKPRVSSGKTVEKSAGFTITNSSPNGAQRVLYGIYDDKGKYVHKEVNGSATSCNFTAAELASLGSTKNGMIQANAYIISNETVGGKKVYYVRQSSYTVTGVEIK